MTPLELLASIVSGVAQLVEDTRRHWRCVRNRHWMVEMTDGPVCRECGTFWPWRD